MAAPNAAAAAPPVVPPTVAYRDFFNDPSKDPYVGNYAAVLGNYAVGPNPATPGDLRTLVANSRLQNNPNAFLLQHSDDQKLHVYLQLERFEPRWAALPLSGITSYMRARES